ncbi:MAG: CsgG/HfaB family protein [Candidatus Methylomirabilales bacterium]
MRRWKVLSSVLVLTAMAVLAWAGDRPPRIWILPFDNPKADASLEYLEEALPALLAVVVSQSDQHVMVDRDHINEVLAEQSLTLEGLISKDTRHRVGRLLGATVMITGSFVKQGQALVITARAYDVETGFVTATVEARGPVGQLGKLVGELYRGLARDLGKRLPDLRADQIDETPLSNLHFMRGLGYYFSARYNHALGEFMQAVREEKLTDISRLWLANSYLAQEQYDHAYLELSRLMLGGSRNFRKKETETKMRACEKHLSADEVKIIRELAAAQSPTVE